LFGKTRVFETPSICLVREEGIQVWMNLELEE